MANLPLLMHTYSGVTPWNVWNLESDVFDLLLTAANNR
jgi:hypothetical protein